MIESGETNEQMFERLGLEKVRWLVSTGNMASQFVVPAIEWLSQRDKEERSDLEDNRELQMRTARSAKIAAQIAAIAAIITLIWEIVSKIWK